MKSMHAARFLLPIFALLSLQGTPLVFSAAGSTFSVGDSDFLLDGKPFLIKAGEMHPSRVLHEYWADRLKMVHAMGLNTVSIYVFWNAHEPRE